MTVPRRTCLAAVVAVAAAVLAGGTAPAGAAAPSPWTLVTPTLPTQPNGDVEGVGCAPDASVCVEVGSYHDATGRQLPLIAQRTRTTWRLVPATPPAAALTVELDSVSCASATACAAVGHWSPTGLTGGFGPNDDQPIAYTWDGTTWTRADLVIPTASVTGRLASVSCSTPTSCVAVGDTDLGDERGRKSLAYAFDGTRWTNLTVPTVSSPNHPYEGLLSISCPAVRTCVATGGGADPAGVILGWNGSTWRKQTPAPVVAGNPGIGELSGVSCPTTTTCTAVGYYYDFDSGKDIPQAERLAAGQWTRDVPPGVQGLRRVSCATTAVCFATTTRTVGGRSVPAVARRSASGSWAVTTLPAPDPAADFVLLTGIACTSASACTAVGNSGAVPFVERYTGQWALEPTVAPLGVFGSKLSGVSCTNTSACTAVGSYTTSSQVLALVERYDGTAWTRQPVPSRDGAAFSDLAGVACPTVTSCVAVGADADDPSGVSVPRPLLLQWNGTTWSTAATPPPATDGALTAVSCGSATSCVAVGYQYGSGDGLAYVLAGSTWTARPVPPPTGMNGLSLTGVSCVGATACHAVGSGFNASGDLVHVDVVWNGTAWSTGPAVGPVDAISCLTATVCTAVGTADQGAEAAVAQRLQGGAWSPRAVQSPGGTSYLSGVSCAGTTCTAVGTADKALVERAVGAGAFRLEAAVTPAGAGGLHGVSCADADHCVAVGTFGGRGVLEVRAG